MADFNVEQGGGRYEAVANPGFITVAGSASIDTKGAWVQLIASTGFDVSSLMVVAGVDGSMSGLLDIGIGAAGSEQVLMPNLFVAEDTATVFRTIFARMPVGIPSGTRIAARVANSVGSKNAYVHVHEGAGGFSVTPILGRFTDYGTTVVGSRGTTITAAGVANTKGAWTQLVASTTNALRYMLVSLGRTSGNFNYSVDIGVGAAAAEQVVVNDLWTSQVGPGGFGVAAIVPSGTRLAARCSADSANATVDVQVVGVG